MNWILGGAIMLGGFCVRLLVDDQRARNKRSRPKVTEPREPRCVLDRATGRYIVVRDE
jgi:hypothetical protein